MRLNRIVQTEMNKKLFHDCEFGKWRFGQVSGWSYLPFCHADCRLYKTDQATCSIECLQGLQVILRWFDASDGRRQVLIPSLMLIGSDFFFFTLPLKSNYYTVADAEGHFVILHWESPVCILRRHINEGFSWFGKRWEERRNKDRMIWCCGGQKEIISEIN